MNTKVSTLIIVFTAVLKLATAVSSPFSSVDLLVCAPSSSNVGAAFSNGKVWITLDNAITWQNRGGPQIFRGLSQESEFEETSSIDEIFFEDNRFLVETDSETEIDVDTEIGESIAQDENENEIETKELNTKPLLAVDDKGNLAFWDSGVLAYSEVDETAWRSVQIDFVKQLLFNNKGVLFALRDNDISVFESNGNTLKLAYQIPVLLPLRIIHGQQGAVYVLTQYRLSAIESRLGQYELRSIMGVFGSSASSVRSIKSIKGDEVISAIVLNKITEITIGKKTRTLFSVSENVENIFMSSRGEIRVYSSYKGMRARRKHGWISLSAQIQAVDALGRFWEADTIGNVTVDGVRNLRSNMHDYVHDLTVLPGIFFDGTWQQEMPDPPVCRNFRINPFPEIKLHYTYKSSESLSIKSEESVQYIRGMFFGITLVWNMEPIIPTSCYRCHNQHNSRRSRIVLNRIKKAESWIKAKERLQLSSNLSQAVSSLIAKEKAEALLLYGL